MKKPCTALFLALLLAPALLQARAEGHFERTLTVSGTVSLDVTTGSGDITIKAGGTDKVVVHGTVHASNDWFSNAESAVHAVESNPPIQQNGNSIRIGYDLPLDVRRHVAISYEISVPADTTAQAVLESRESALRCRPRPDRARFRCGTSEAARGCKPEVEASGPRTSPRRFTRIPAAATLKPISPGRATWMSKPVQAESICGVSRAVCAPAAVAAILVPMAVWAVPGICIQAQAPFGWQSARAAVSI